MPGLLRAGGDTAELNPQPGLAQLAGLLERPRRRASQPP